MLKTQVLHPQILSSLAAAGHLSTVLITDANYPNSTKPHPDADIVWANFMPGVLRATTVLEMVCRLVPVEAVHVMEPERTGAYAIEGDPPIWPEYEKILAEVADFDAPLQRLEKPAFNDMAQEPDLALVIATGEKAGFSNVILTIGVVPAGD